MTVFVPVEDPVKIIKLHVENKTDEERQISLTYYAEWVLGVQRQANARLIVTNWLDNEKIMTDCPKYVPRNFS
ncbi:hypothetical protein KHA80_00545 [Anaerobacillus sp. HL2]|nr:hypothetical protein KHA80_00545 [Anaerobacillus sp. HL2]